MVKRFNDLTNSLAQESQAVKDKFRLAEQALTKPTKKELVVRVGVSLPAQEAALITQLQAELSGKGYLPSKSEILRAGLMALNTLGKDKAKAMVNGLVVVKKGRG